MELVHMIGKVVEAVSCELLDELRKIDSDIHAINYQYGPAEQIKETLKQYDNDPKKAYEKYPLIMLVTPFPEDFSTDYTRAKPKIGIAYHTDVELKSAERYQKSFNKILIPIYDSFIENLVSSGYFAVRSPKDLKATRQIRDDIGRKPFLNINGASSDYIDGIEITNIELPIIPVECCTTGDFH